MKIPVARSLFESNDAVAGKLREYFAVRGILALNLIRSPGSGKTSLLERTLADLRHTYRMAVIEGDLQTDNDARRIAATGAQVVQINTGGGCHLDSGMILGALDKLDMEALDILFIENVGNLVCPVEFDCGEDHKAALLSVAEGDDKPEKYPLLFHRASVLLINKTDLLPYVDFSMERASRFARQLNAELAILPVSCRTGAGLAEWYAWLAAARAAKGTRGATPERT